MNARHMVGCAAAVIVAVSPSRAVGQLARLRGRVFDSVAALPLAGARVQLVNADDRAQAIVSTTSDSLGQFVLDSIARGRYIAGFLHPMLDSLGLIFAQRLLTVSEQGDVRLDLAVPAPERLEKALCGANSEQDSTGAVLGYVLDAHSLAGSDSATVLVEWAEFSLGAGHVSQRVMIRRGTTGPGGWFLVCGVPTSTSVIVRAVSGIDTTGPVQIDVPKSRIARRNVYIDHPLPAGALMTGWVRTEDGVPIPGARVSLYGSAIVAVTNEDGAFQLTGVPGGSQTMITHAIGFVPDERPVDVTDRHVPVIVGLLSVRRFLDTVHVKAQRQNLTSAVGFDDRKRAGAGKFFTSTDVEHLRPQVLTDLMRRVSSLELSTDNAHQTKIRMRGDVSPCTPAIFLDGKQLIDWELAELDGLVPPTELAGMEIYTPSMTPAEFRTRAGCGTVLVWTRALDRSGARR